MTSVNKMNKAQRSIIAMPNPFQTAFVKVKHLESLEKHIIISTTALIAAKEAASAVYKLNSKKAFWFLMPIQLFIHGQWWSIAITHLPQTEQWWLLGGLQPPHLEHDLLYFCSSFVLLIVSECTLFALLTVPLI
jgi:hypothetical protein